MLAPMDLQRNKLVLFSEAPESLSREVIAAQAHFPRVRLEVEVIFPELTVIVHPLEGLDRSRGSAAVKKACIDLAHRLAGNVVSRFGFSLPEALVSTLARRRLTLSCGESCTGGLVSHLITNVSGASDVLRLGAVVYANEAKTSLLGVRESTLARHGAVSRAAASQMLRGLIATGGSDCAVATTGIAGPTGGTTEKPVGLVYLGACAAARKRVVKRTFRARTRSQFKMLASFSVMKLLLDLVRSEGEP